MGAVGTLQFDVVAYRLRDEYKVDCAYDMVSVSTARWVYCDDAKMLEEFKRKPTTTSQWTGRLPDVSGADAGQS